MRRAAKVDDNQKDIINALRAIGCTVQPLHAVGQGCPDLLVGFRSRNFLLEVKDGAKYCSQQALTKPQIDWHSSWEGQVAIVNSVASAIEYVNRVRK